jgi:riboflavin synthase
MFGGIIDKIGEVVGVEPSGSGRRMIVRAVDYWKNLSEGASVAVDGVCLTLIRRTEDDAEFDVVPETLRCSTLANLAVGGRVNLQKSLAVGERIDGHFVQGHVDAMARVERIGRGTEVIAEFTVDEQTMPCIVPKGSIAIDGISLTVAAVQSAGFSVALIPTTLSRTTLGEKRPGDSVNIETDILVRSIVHHLQSIQS